MFKLYSNLKKRSRGIKILAERQYVAISRNVITVGSDPQTKQYAATISIYNERESFYLDIPQDKIQSVVDRLLEAKAHNERDLAQKVNA